MDLKLGTILKNKATNELGSVIHKYRASRSTRDTAFIYEISYFKDPNKTWTEMSEYISNRFEIVDCAIIKVLYGV